ncbi:uncharacterized protein [Narcine bancroftii]|uniref:uncharacterized protein isoform X2 n=1 Tax=Narcine bancroftii TaxID=1343680 RepID=UPI00383174D1
MNDGWRRLVTESPWRRRSWRNRCGRTAGGSGSRWRTFWRSQPFEDDLIINLEDMTYESESGPKDWGSIDVNLYLLRKRSKNISKIKSCESYEVDVNLKQSTKLYEVDVSQAHFEKIDQSDLSSNLSSQADHTFEVLKDGQSTGKMSKLQTFVSMGNMNVGDKYEIAVDMLATSNSNLEKQVVVECVGRTKDNPLIIFTPLSKLKIGSSHNYNDCSDGFPDTTFKELNHSSKPRPDNQDISNIAPLSSSQTLVKPPCLLNSTELNSHQLEESGCDAMNLGETTSTSVELTPTLADSSGLSDITLIDIYPTMVASISHLLNRSYKMQVASRLIKHYQRLQFNASKSKLNSTLSRIKNKSWMNVQKLKRPRYHSITELKPCTEIKQLQDKAISPKDYKTSRDNLEMFTHTVGTPLRTVLQTSERNKLKHFISSASVPSKFHSVQNLFKTKVKEMDAFESVYQSLVQSSLCFPATMGCPDILTFHSFCNKEMNSMSNIICSPFQLSRKRAACIDQAKETSRLPLKRFRSLPESSSSKQSNQDMLMPNTLLQKQVYHCTQMSGFYSPRNKQAKEKISAVEFSKWKDHGLYSNSALVLPRINGSQNTVILSLSPRPRKRVCRQLDYNNMTTPV